MITIVCGKLTYNYLAHRIIGVTYVVTLNISRVSGLVPNLVVSSYSDLGFSQTD